MICHAVRDVQKTHVIEILQHVPQQDASLDTMDNTVTSHVVRSAETTSVTETMDSAWIVIMDTMDNTVTSHALNTAWTTNVTETMESAWDVRMDIMGKCVTRYA